MIEGSGSGSIPLTSGSGYGRPKNMWIRIRNTGFCCLALFFWQRLDGIPQSFQTPWSEDPDPTQKEAWNRNRELKASYYLGEMGSWMGRLHGKFLLLRPVGELNPVPAQWQKYIHEDWIQGSTGEKVRISMIRLTLATFQNLQRRNFCWFPPVLVVAQCRNSRSNPEKKSILYALTWLRSG